MNFLYTVFMVVMTINTVVMLHDRFSGAARRNKDKETVKS